MIKRRIIAWFGGIVGLSVTLAIVVALVLPHLVDSQAVKDKVRALVSEKLGGTVTMAKIELSWFPWPAVSVHEVGIVIDDISRCSVETIEIHPSILSLFKGRIIASRLVLERPVVEARLPDRSQEPLNIDELEEKLRAALRTLISDFPLVSARISDGSATIGLGGRPPVILREFDARIGETSAKLEFEISALSNISARIRFTGNIASDSLEAETHMTIEQLRLGKAMASFAPRPVGYVTDGEMDLDLSLKSVGLSNFKGEIKGSMPSLTLAQGNKKAVIKGKEFKGRVADDERTLRVAIDHFDLIAPRLNFSGELIVDRTSSTTGLKLASQKVDAKEILEFARPVVDDIAPVQEMFRYVHSGKISEIKFETRGGSLAEMTALRSMVASGKIRDGKVFIPALDLHLENVDGALAIADGILESKELSARHGKVRAWEGKLRFGLGDKTIIPLQLDSLVEGDAREVHALLVRQIKDQATLGEISKIRNLDGEIGGRVTLSGPIESPVPKIFVTRAKLNAAYEPVPFPISVAGGHFAYDGGVIRIEQLDAKLGRSSLSKLSGSLNIDAKRELNVESATLSLDVEQTHAWLSRFTNLRTHLDKVKSARGRLELASLSFSGPLNNPSRWEFRGAGSIKGLVVSHANLPGPITLAQGRFDTTAERLSFSEVKAELLDASVAVAFFLEKPIEGPPRVEGTGSGIIGRQMAQWLHRQSDLSERFVLRSPLKFTDGRVSWSEAGDLSVRGQITVADGPRLYLDVVRSPQGFSVKEITVAHGTRRARMAFEAARDRIELAFAGALEQKTLSELFLIPPLPSGFVQGDIKASYSLKPALHFFAVGKLEGHDLPLPLDGKPLVVDRFFVEGGKDRLLIRSADLQWRGSRFGLSGLAAVAKDGLSVDMDVAADRLTWEDIDPIVNQAGGAPEAPSAEAPLPPLRGALRLKAEEFAFESYSSKPFHISAAFSPRGITGEVERSVVCGIHVLGKFDAQDERLALDLRLSAADGQLEPTSRCLTKGQIHGTYSLKADLKGAGDRKGFRQSLKGDVEFVARDGRFIRASGVDATFDYLNATGDFNLVFPDLDKDAFPYRLIRARGRLDGATFTADELVVRGTSLTITGEGKVDLERDQIDARGLVSVAAPGSQLVKDVPLLGSILGGSLIGIPLRVSGSLDRPNVSYLAPKDVGQELLNMPLRTLGLPLEAIRIFTPSIQEPK